MIDARFREFIQSNPGWARTSRLDDLRAEDYDRLDQQNHVYLDYTGGGLYGASQVLEHAEFMAKGVFGNPHSGNPASLKMTEYVEEARRAVLDFFNASPDQYTVVFTPNASGALHAVGESYPFASSGHFALTSDNHNSVNGIREFAANKHAPITYLPLTRDELRLDREAFDAVVTNPTITGDKLLAFPAQSNYSGVKHPLDLVGHAQDHGWDVLLDCAAYAPSSPIDFSDVSPDFACFSFYKIFGYPTGVGCLVVKHNKLAKLERPWFAGGTIQIASVVANSRILAPGEAAFEDGTVNYLNLPAITAGLRRMTSIGMDVVNERVQCLTSWLLDELGDAQHDNGQKMVTIHGPTTTEARGGTVTITIVDPDGEPYPGARIEELAGDANISIRTGCFCNPGAGETAFGLDEPMLDKWFHRSTDIGFQDLVSEVRAETGLELSALRISVGLVSNFADVERLLDFVNGLSGRSVASLGPAGSQEHVRDSA